VNRLRHKLILIFLAATLVPLAVILWIGTALLEQSLGFMTTDELDRASKSLENIAREYYRQAREGLKNRASKSLENIAREYYRQAREGLKNEVGEGRIEPQRFLAGNRPVWPPAVKHFWESTDAERFTLSEPEGDRLYYLVRHGEEVWQYSKDLNGVRMQELARQYSQARDKVASLGGRDLHRGLTYTLLLLSAAIWIVALASVVYFANRISSPIQALTAGLFELASGKFETRLPPGQRDEVGRAIQAFNHTAEHLEQSRDRLVYLTQVASWQMLARKMAHELKNSLTPIRLTVEEILAREQAHDPHFLEQAAQVVIEEVESLERRVRAFSEFATEPATNPVRLDLNALLEERVQFLSVAHPEVIYAIRTQADSLEAWADGDQIKGILTNLLENAAEAAGAGGNVLAISEARGGNIAVEVHDSGPGLSAEARSTLFEPSISFKKHGMGLGLSISRKNALLAGGDLICIEGQLRGAAFRLTLPPPPQ
jgi:two-component system, NtrC family, nitrogen regulation sensor histidine kinase NtrY